MPSARADGGQARAWPPPVDEALLEAKEDNPNLSVKMVIRTARQSPELHADLPLPRSTVHQLLARHGLINEPKEDAGQHCAETLTGRILPSKAKNLG